MSRMGFVAYGLGQAGRVGWYTAHYLLAQRALAGPLAGRSDASRRLRRLLSRDMLELFRRDWENVASGRYLPPREPGFSALAELRRSAAFVADLPRVRRRRSSGDARQAATAGQGALPAYYLQNFHFQTDGYLSRRSAELYDVQVEAMFTGAADAMRRQALPHLGAYFARVSSRAARLVDLGCGTGRLLAAAKRNWPRLSVTGIDLSRPYLEIARERLDPWSRAALVQAPAEALPLADASQDVATCIFVLHELPRGIRRRLAAEAARVLKPGGRLVVVDSIQAGDVPDYDRLLDSFPRSFHEPYFADYLRCDLAALFAPFGLALRGTERAFLSKVALFEREAA